MAGKTEKTLFLGGKETPPLEYRTRLRWRNGLSLRTPLRGASILRGGFGRRGRILQTLTCVPCRIAVGKARCF